MLDHQVNSFSSTLFRQAMFAEFELMIHENVELGGVFTPEFLFDTCLDLVMTYHGDAFAWDEAAVYEAVVMNAPLGVSVWDSLGNLIMVNNKWKSIWAISDQNLQNDMNRNRPFLEFTTLK